MVKNREIETEFNLFADIWTAYKALLPVKPRTDESYWEEVTAAIAGVMKKYPGQLAKDLLLAILGDLERRCKESEDKDTGC